MFGLQMHSFMPIQKHSPVDTHDASCEIVLKHLIDIAVQATPHASIPHDLCMNPLRGLHPSLGESCTTEQLLRAANHLRFEILLRIDEVRFQSSLIVRMNEYLKDAELCGDRPFLKFIATFIRNNLVALGVMYFESPSDYREKREHLGGKLYHIEDIIAGLEEAKLASNDESF